MLHSMPPIGQENEADNSNEVSTQKEKLRSKQFQTRDYLKSKKWFSINKSNIKLKKMILQLKNILVKFKTNNITKIKNLLSEKLITEVYIKRFTSELSALNPSKSIKVELVSDGKKGKTSHRVCKYKLQVFFNNVIPIH